MRIDQSRDRLHPLIHEIVVTEQQSELLNRAAEATKPTKELCALCDAHFRCKTSHDDLPFLCAAD